MASIINAREWQSSTESPYFVTLEADGQIALHEMFSSKKGYDIRPQGKKLLKGTISDLDYSPSNFGWVVVNNHQPEIHNLIKESSSILEDPIILQTADKRISTCLTFSKDDKLAVGLEASKGHHGIHIYDNPFEINKYRSFLKVEQVNSLKFIPSNSSSLLVGTNHGLREIDLREDHRSSHSAFSMNTPYNDHIGIGPFNDYFFSSVNSKHGNLAIWDRRYLHKSNLNNSRTSKENNALILPRVFTQNSYSSYNTIPCYRFSPWNYNELTTLHQEIGNNYGNELTPYSMIRRWDFGYEVKNIHNNFENDLNNNINNSYSIKSRQNVPDKNIDSLFVSKLVDTKIDPIYAGKSVVSFDHCEQLSGDGHFGSFVILTASGNVARVPIVDSEILVEFNTFNDIVLKKDPYLIVRENVNDNENNDKESKVNVAKDDETKKDVNNNTNTKESINSNGVETIAKETPNNKGNNNDNNTDNNNASSNDTNDDTNNKNDTTYDNDDKINVNIKDSIDDNDNLKHKSDDKNDEAHNVTFDYNDDENDGAQLILDLVNKNKVTDRNLITSLFKNDISSVMFSRLAEKGYSLTTLESNSKLFSTTKDVFKESDTVDTNYEQLRICWKWLYHSNETCSKKLTVQNGLNISFEGIYNIWDGAKEILKDESRRFNADLNPNFLNISSKSSEKEYIRILEKIITMVTDSKKSYSIMNFNSGTKKKIQRLYCLFSCGWYIDDEEFDTKVEKLVDYGLYEKAAALSVFQGKVIEAIDILSDVRENEEGSDYNGVDLNVIGAAMMGFFNRNTEKIKDTEIASSADYPEGEPLWKNKCRDLATSLQNPYLRAIFAYLVNRDWQDVLDEVSLPLKDKLFIALKYLPDDKLTHYLKESTTEVIRSGNPEGIMLTGLTRKGISLLQTYIDMYADVQTVALISAFAVPRFFDDVRANDWIRSYCELMNSWKMFSERAHFDIRHRQLSKNDLYYPKKSILPSMINELEEKRSFNNDHDSKYDEEILKQEKHDKLFFLHKKERQLHLKCIQCERDISHLLHNKKPYLGGVLPNKTFSKKITSNNKNNNAINNSNNNSGTSLSSGVTGNPTGGSKKNKDKTVITCVCGASLPKCAICLYSLGAPIRYNTDPKVSTGDYVRDWGCFCLNCNHGMHSKHAEQWFEGHKVCPVPDCDCTCMSDN